MKFKDLYLKGLDRKVNPAVSASDLDESTIQTEINEYVFTDEIINNLYKILSNIRENQTSSSGIWINGYYGSGKSHFLKYIDYCLSQKYGKEALQRLHDAVAERKPMTLDVEVGEMDDLIRWYTTKATVETVMFNIGTVHDANSDENTVFTQVFWNQFNGMRGFNDSHLALAENLEKALDDDGKYQEFLKHVSDEGYDWKRNIHRFSGSKLDLALKLAEDVDDKLSYDVIRTRIKNNEVNVSVEAFADELKEYLEKKNDKNYRMVFLCDEISQFIDNRGGLLLQLQEVVKHSFEECKSQIWFACTAQQDLSEVIQSSSIQKTSEDYGKIMGRFEVRASLQSTKPEYITQKRILEKKGDVELKLEDLYKKNKAKLDAQFILPTTYNSYKDGKDFADYYPFVPYQFKLITRVLDAFVNMNYVDKQVKGGERSLINITFSIAKETAEMEVGEFISFDKFFGAVFQGSLQHLGLRALSNARDALSQVEDEDKRAFYERVVYVLFMICNLQDSDKQQFSATIDNVVTLLMTKLDESKAAIKSDVSEAIAYLDNKKVIRRIKTDGGTEIFEFYTEEESKVAQMISNQVVDSNTFCEELRNIIFPYLGNPSNKFTYVSRSFSIGANVDGRSFLANNGDVVVDFLTTATTDVATQYALNNNQPNHLVYFLYPLYRDNKELRNMFLDYCRVQKYCQQDALSPERQRVMNIFKERASEMMKKEIKPAFQELLDKCPVISGQYVISDTDLSKKTGKERYDTALNKHFSLLYSHAKEIGDKYPKTNAELQQKILRPVDKTFLDMPLQIPETRIKDYLVRIPHDVTVYEVVHDFSKAPYGWSDLATIYYLNDLVRRHLYTFAYNNSPVDDKKEIANNIVRESSRYTVEPAQIISQKLINDFIASWKKVFNVFQVDGANDSSELFTECKENEKSPLNERRKVYRDLLSDFAGKPFVNKLKEAIDIMDGWSNIRDHQKFFETIISDSDKAAKLNDECKTIEAFRKDQFDNYVNIFNFISKEKTNFEDLPDKQKEAATALMQIQTDEEPWEHFRAYMKLMNPLRNALANRRKELVKKVTDAYNKVFDELETYAAKVKVDRNCFAQREETISKVTSSPNFLVLNAAIIDAGRFLGEQISLIDASIKPNDPKIAYVSLNTKTDVDKPLRSEEDIMQYLEGLKKQLENYLDGKDGIIIR